MGRILNVNVVNGRGVLRGITRSLTGVLGAFAKIGVIGILVALPIAFFATLGLIWAATVVLGGIMLAGGYLLLAVLDRAQPEVAAANRAMALEAKRRGVRMSQVAAERQARPQAHYSNRR